MSKCNIQLSLEPANSVIKSGDWLTGKMVVLAEEDFDATEVVLILAWKVIRKGMNVHTEKAVSLALSGETHFSTGELRTLPFKIKAPLGPLSYSGNLFNIQWELEGRIGIRWGVDPRADLVIDLQAGTPATPLPGPGVKVKQGSSLGGWIAGLGIGLAGLIFLIVLWSRSNEPIMWFVTLGVGGLLMLFFLIGPLRQLLAGRHTGKVETVLDQEVVYPGSEVHCSITLDYKSLERIEKVTAALVGKEKIVVQSGKNTHTYHHTFFQKTETLPSEYGRAKGDRLTYAFSLQVPPNGPLTLDLSRQDLYWQVELRIYLQGAPDWVKSLPIKVIL